jgi:amino acid transporter/GNAT superfamily N-acetyltransferase
MRERRDHESGLRARAARSPPRQGQDTEDARQLSRFGYSQELWRRLGGFSSFAIGFSVISVLTGVTSTFGDALAAGGPIGLGLGWPLVSLGTLLVALSMAELASAFPTAGALYHWSALLGGARFGWAAAMLNLLGQVALAAAIDLACAQALSQALGRPGLAYALFAGILLGHGALNAASVRLVGWLNDASATIHLLAVAALAGLLLARGRVHGVDYLASSGGHPEAARGFVASLVLGVWTFTGFDAAAHVSEETHLPQRRSPVGIVSAVVVSAVAGYALVVSLVLAVRDDGWKADPQAAALFVLRGALGDRTGSAALGLAVVAMWFAGLSSVTSASRMLFAFARDGGVPGARALRAVDARTQTPVNATGACVLFSFGLVAITAPLSEAIFLAVAALATAALYASYGLPIFLGAIARLKGRWTRRGPWTLGRAGALVAWAAVLWTLFVFAVCALANGLAMRLFLALLVALTALWVFFVRHAFVGPRIDLTHFEQAADTSALIVRAGQPEDAAHLSALALRAKAHWGYSPAFLAACEAELRVRPDEVLTQRVRVAESGQQIVGFVVVRGAPPFGALDALFVEPRRMGQGVGRALWDAAVADARAAGFSRLTIDSDPQAEGFYLRMGAVRRGLVPSGSIPDRFLPRLDYLLG